jgi:flagellar protein FlaG
MPRDLALGPVSPPQLTDPAAQRARVVLNRDATDAPAVSEKAIEARRQQVIDAVAETNTPHNGRLVIERDVDTGQFVHKVLDPDTGEVVSQWPQERFIALAKKFGDVVGMFTDRKA